MSSQLKKGMDMKKDNNEQKENNIVDVEKALKEMRESWADICTAFGADPEIPVSPEVLRNITPVLISARLRYSPCH